MAAFEAATPLGPTDLQVTCFPAAIQAVAACTIALGPVYDDPLGVVPGTARSTSARASPVAAHTA